MHGICWFEGGILYVARCSEDVDCQWPVGCCEESSSDHRITVHTYIHMYICTVTRRTKTALRIFCVPIECLR